MKSKIAKMSVPVLVTLSSIAGFVPVSAVDDICNSSASDEVKDAAGCNGSGDLNNVVVNILSAIIGVAGFIAVIWIIIGGVNYMTSSGDPSKTKKARDTILYACIGLIICVLSFVIVNFVILNILKNA